MNLLDERTLRDGLHDAARALAPPDAGPAAVLERARHELELRRAPRQERPAHRHPRRRTLLVAAAAVAACVLALTGIGVGLRTDGPRTSALSTHLTGGISSTTLIGVPAARFDSAATLEGSESALRATFSTKPAPPASSLASKVISTGSVDLDAGQGSLDGFLARLDAIALHDGGFVSSSQVSAGNGDALGRSTGEITVRVPQPRFDGLVTSVEALGHATSVVTNSQDVTSEYVDYQSQIAAAESSRAQYLAIMAKATTIAQILAVQAQLNTIESEIDQLEGQRNVLDNQAAYGTLTVHLNPGVRPVVPPVHSSSFTRAWHTSVDGFIAAVDGLVSGLGPALFALLCLLAVVVASRAGWRASRRRLL